MPSERTVLAWQRTALALLAAAAAVARLTVDRLGAAMVAGVLLAVALAGWVVVASRRPGVSDGRAHAALALGAAALVLTEAAAVLTEL